MPQDNPTEHRTVMLVMSNEAERYTIASLLQAAGYTIQHATYADAVHTAVQTFPILIILDVEPFVAPNPFPVLNPLYANVRTRNIPVLLLTAADRIFDPSITALKSLQRRRIGTFRKVMIEEHIVSYVEWYIAAHAKAVGQSVPMETREPPPASTDFLPEWETTLPKTPQTRANTKDGAQMIYIPAGPFQMGDDDQEDNPQHIVHLSGFWMYKNLVTVGQYRQFCQETGHTMPEALRSNPSYSKENHPIVHVNWDEAVAYAEWAGGSLPTEAQFEKVARGPMALTYPWGNEWDPTRVWSGKNKRTGSDGTHPVGELGVSPYGCTDMAGNVWQWCHDWYAFDYWVRAQGKDPQGPQTGEDRVVRGGSWRYSYRDAFRGSSRYYYSPSSGYNGLPVGFRCVVAADFPPTSL